VLSPSSWYAILVISVFCPQFRTLNLEPHFRKLIITHLSTGNTLWRKLHQQFTYLYWTCRWQRCKRLPCSQTIISISGGQGQLKKGCVRTSRGVACFDNHIEDDQDCYQQTNVFWPTPPTVTNGGWITNTHTNKWYIFIQWQLRAYCKTRAEYISVHS
jgi:hypothetical protein